MTLNYESLLPILPVNILVVDQALTIIYSNRSSHIGETIIEPALKIEIERCFSEKGSFSNVLVASRRDAANSELIPGSGLASGQYAELSDKNVVCVCISDISRIEEHLNDMQVELESARCSAGVQDKALQNISHDLRSPLNAIIGFSKLLVEESDKEKLGKYRQVILTNAQLINSLAEDILELGRAETGNLHFDYKTIDVNAFMRSMTDMAEMSASIDTVVNCVLGQKELMLHTAPERLGQVMQNLIDNALKYTERGSITVGYELRDKMVYFYVRDTGPGIPASKIKYVFDRFWREKKEVPGLGLGLPICKEIIEKMGGKIGVISTGENAGCTFWFTLPLKKGSPETEEGVVQEEITIPGEDLPVVLIAEDNESNFLLYEALFEDIFKVVHAWNGAEAVEMAKSYSPKLILMDISMPIKDGYEAAAEIRSAGLDIPIIAVTAYAFSSDKEKILQCGFDAYMSKPINAEQLLEAMEQALTRKNQN